MVLTPHPRPPWYPDEAAVAAIVKGSHGDPFAVLGMHGGVGTPLTVRVFWPGADSVGVLDSATGETTATLQKLDPAGFFAGRIEGRGEPFAYRLSLTAAGVTWEAEDPYRFPPLL